MKKIVTIGGGMQDIFPEYKPIESLHVHTKEEDLSYVCIPAGRKIELTDIVYHCGGGATNSAVSFTRAGFEVEAFIKIGNDKAGDFIVEKLTKENVSTAHIVRTNDAPTGQSFIIPGPQGNNAVLVYRGANITLKKEELPESVIQQANQLYITSLSGPAAPLLIPITQLAKKHNVSVAVNPGTSQLHAGAQFLKDALNRINILILNSYEAELLMTSLKTTTLSQDIPASNEPLPELLTKTIGSATTHFTLKQFFNTVHASGPEIIVVTNGAEGVYASDTKNIYFHPSIKVTIMSTLGAGDAFGSCFVAQLNNNKSIEDALRMGVLNSSSVIQHIGAQTGLLTNDEIEKAYMHLDKNLLKKYSL
jgi:ribokinase